MCTARAWLLMAGFSLAFGAMFSKTWRVHSIFTDVKLNKKVIKDYQLFMVVGILLAVDMIIMLTWQFADPFYRSTKQIEPVVEYFPQMQNGNIFVLHNDQDIFYILQHHPALEDVLLIQENEYCQSERITIFIGVIYAYKGLLLVSPNTHNAFKMHSHINKYCVPFSRYLVHFWHGKRVMSAYQR